MTPDQIDKALKLRRCSFLPGSWDKRFARDIGFVAEHHPAKELTERQSKCLDNLVHKYRRQIGKS